MDIGQFMQCVMSYCHKEIKTVDIYYGVIPFIFIQIILLVILYKFPEIITWLPKKL